MSTFLSILSTGVSGSVCSALAAEMSDDHSRGVMLDNAAGYDKLAIRAEGRQPPPMAATVVKKTCRFVSPHGAAVVRADFRPSCGV